MSTKRYTLPALRRYLVSQPATTWNSYSRHPCVDKTQCLLGKLENLTGEGVEEGHPVLRPFKPLARHGVYPGETEASLCQINNGHDPRYQQATPRARVLAAIDDLIARKVPKAP